MALACRTPIGAIEYVVPQSVQDAAPQGAIYVHLAWFNVGNGRWIGEWAGYAQSPERIQRLFGERRLHALDQWVHHIQRRITPYGSEWYTVDAEWDVDRYDACPVGGAVCLDVTRFGWPVGDHIWHRWDDLHRLLDWPDSSGHRFIEIDVRTLRVEAQQHSHRPLRDAVPGQKVFDITGTPLERAWGGIHGRFVQRGNGLWGFEPDTGYDRAGRPLVLPAERKTLIEAVIDLQPIATVPNKIGIPLSRY